MRTINAILFCLLAGSVFGWPPPQFAKGTFAVGTLAVGPHTAAPAGPGDAYESSLFAYYKFEDTSAPVVDSAHARNLSERDGATSTASASGFIGNALQVNTAFSGGSAGVSLLYNDSMGNDFDFDGNFTVRLWIKTSNTGMRFDNLVGDFSWELYLGDSGANPGHVYFYLNPIGTDLDGGSINDGNWHRIIAWFDGSIEGIQIDNNTPVTASAASHTPGGSSNEMDIGTAFHNSAAVYVDEVAFWNVALTSGDRLFDWNGGAGETYPLP